MEKIDWKVSGMHCANCALSINKVLAKQGMQQISVNPISGHVSFNALPDSALQLPAAIKAVENLGYTVQAQGDASKNENAPTYRKLWRFWFCLPFTLLLMSHMIPALHIHWLMQPMVQLVLALPVFVVGMQYFGSSAWRSLRGGVPNMDVLIALGASAAFGYSTYGLFTSHPSDFLFFETAASIITIVFFGNYLEEISVHRTQAAINKLSHRQVVMANMIAYDDQHNENIFTVERSALRVGDLIMVRTGEEVPTDCKILSGDAEVSEALLSGESLPVPKKPGETLVGGSVMVNGQVKAYVQAVGNQTVMSGIVAMMKKAQAEKPPVQQLADKISAVFVPVVVAIALLTGLGNYYLGHHSVGTSLLRSIAVLVIACPCAMGLATPAAIAVGLGRAARYGVLFTNVSTMEAFARIKHLVFDKTGTLTTGKFTITNYGFFIDEQEGKMLVYHLEKMSTHPIARSIAAAWKTSSPMRWKTITEQKGLGMHATDAAGNTYQLGSKALLNGTYDGPEADVYLLKNGAVVGYINIADELRPEAAAVVDFCKRSGIETTLLSGDTQAKCAAVAQQLGIANVVAEQTPANKLAFITALTNREPTAMVGDGINDAPALAKATISISLSEAAQLAIQSASVVLTQSGLSQLPNAMLLGKQTYFTIKTNLFWAFAYNIVAIPVAAFGFLSPTFGALVMGGSDVVLALNSLWLGVKKLR
ncbi:MAG: cadmium-translocating P-type ATPase [Bacteroidetes bacterium]|nr:MAG: cadmium-translocating P-type ATPase [Bacteroidota bacterium]